jgi:hypothetical protein
MCSIWSCPEEHSEDGIQTFSWEKKKNPFYYCSSSANLSQFCGLHTGKMSITVSHPLKKTWKFPTVGNGSKSI